VTGLKETTIDIGGTEVHIAVANGLQNAKILLDLIKRGKKKYHLVEIMACPGGCVMGGGQPYPPFDHNALDSDLALRRAKALYAIDDNKQLRRSDENPDIEHLYADYIGEPNGEKAHKLLHTHYQARLPRGVR
jgi:iron only hydrogenase large subunit-like protein